MKYFALITTLLAMSLNIQARSYENNDLSGRWSTSAQQIILDVESDGTYSLSVASLHLSGKWLRAKNGKYLVLVEDRSGELDALTIRQFDVIVLKLCGEDKIFWGYGVKRVSTGYKKGRKIYLHKVILED